MNKKLHYIFFAFLCGILCFFISIFVYSYFIQLEDEKITKTEEFFTEIKRVIKENKKDIIFPNIVDTLDNSEGNKKMYEILSRYKNVFNSYLYSEFISDEKKMVIGLWGNPFMYKFSDEYKDNYKEDCFPLFYSLGANGKDDGGWIPKYSPDTKNSNYDININWFDRGLQ